MIGKQAMSKSNKYNNCAVPTTCEKANAHFVIQLNYFYNLNYIGKTKKYNYIFPFESRGPY